MFRMTKELSAKPMCAACCKPVERMTEEETSDELILTAHCHGDRQRIRLGPAELAAIRKIDLSWAFTVPGVALPPLPTRRALGPVSH